MSKEGSERRMKRLDELDRRASGERHASMIAEGEKTLEKTEEETRREAALRRISKHGGVRVC